MNYYKMLYEETAMLLLYTVQMADYSYSTVITRYLGEHRTECDMDKYISVIAILLSLDRNSCKISRSLLDKLEQTLNVISDDYISDYFSKEDCLAFYADLKTAKSNIDFYRTRKGKLE